MSEQPGDPSADQPADQPATQPANPPGDQPAAPGPPGPVYGDGPRYGYQQSAPPGQPAPASEYQSQPPGQPPAYPYGQPPYGQSSSGQLPYQGPYDQPTAPQQPYPQAYPPSYPPGPQQTYPAGAAPGYGVPGPPVYPYAPWIRRVGAYLVDFAPNLIAQIPFYIGYVLWLTEISAGTARGTETLPTAGLGWMVAGGLLLLAAFGWQIYNRWVVAGRTGQSLGKRVLKLRLLAEGTGQPIGVLNAFLRDMLHILDAMAYVGYLWPLWDVKRQTFSDKLMNTVVVTAEPPALAHG